MRPSLFVDANFFCALYNDSDAHYSKAEVIVTRLNNFRLITSNFVLLETYTVLSQRASKKEAVAFGERLKKDSPYAIYWISKEFEEEVWKIFTSIKDKNFSYVDASILAVIKKGKISHLLSFDTGFSQLQKTFGFTLIGA